MTEPKPECSRCTSGHTVPVKFICTLCADKERDEDRKAIAQLKDENSDLIKRLIKKDAELTQAYAKINALIQPRLPL